MKLITIVGSSPNLGLGRIDVIAQYEQLGAEIQVAYADEVSVITGSLPGMVVVVFTKGEGGIYSKLGFNILAACSGNRV